MAKDKYEATRQGVDDAWGFWLSQHDVSVPETILDAVKEAFTRWLDSNEDELMQRIADAIAKKYRPPSE